MKLHRTLFTGIFLLVVILGMVSFAYYLRGVEIQELQHQLEVERASNKTLHEQLRAKATAGLTSTENTESGIPRAVRTLPSKTERSIRPDTVIYPALPQASSLRLLVTPPHKLLGGRRICFRVPEGWLVTPVSVEENAAYSREWQWKHWPQIGIQWRLTKADRSIIFNVSMAYRSHSDTDRPSDAVNVYPTNRVFRGFTYVREHNSYLRKRVIILKVPNHINEPLYLVCDAHYAKKARNLAWSATDAIINSVSIR